MDTFGILIEEFKHFFDSGTMMVIKIIIGIYLAVIMIDIILLLFQRGVAEDLRQTVAGMNMPKELVNKKSKLKLQWENILARMQSDNPSEYKVAVIEADRMVEDLIRRLGYKGKNMSEILSEVKPGQIENMEEIRKSHEVRNRIIHDESFVLDRETAKKTLQSYEDFLDSFEVFD